MNPFVQKASGLVVLYLPAAVLFAQQPPSSTEVQLLVRQLESADVPTWQDAEHQLVERAPVDSWEQCETFLKLLPQPNPELDPALQQRLEKVEEQIERRWAQTVVQPTRLSLITGGTDLEEVVQKIEEQTGNHLVDLRERFDQRSKTPAWNFSLSDQTYWPLLDKFLDASQLDLYTSSGEQGVGILNRSPRTRPRYGQADYVGPFRFEALSLTMRRNLRQTGDDFAQVEIDISWEPRLRPLSFSLRPEDVQVVGDDGTPIQVDSRMPVLGAETLVGNYATQLTIPLELPPRRVTAIRSLKGKITGLVPGRVAEFRFPNASKADNEEQFQGGVRVVLVTVRQNQGLWEVHMRLEVSDSVSALSLQRGWAYQNVAYLENPQGEMIEHAGFETTMQNERVLGLAYFFDLTEDNLEGYSWVYRSPAAIVDMPLEFELEDIPLP